MKTFFENKLAFVAISFLFTSALTWNVDHGSQAPLGSHLPSAPAVVEIAHGPSMPPTCDGCVRVAHGPSMPPTCDGCIRVAHGPSMPPTCDGCVVSRRQA